MNREYYLPTVLFLSVICITKQVIVISITIIVFTKNVSTAGKQTKIILLNNGRVELSQSKKVTASKTTSKNFFKSSRKYLLTALCVCFIAFYSYHMTADMIYNVCYFYRIVRNDSYTYMFMRIGYMIHNDIN